MAKKKETLKMDIKMPEYDLETLDPSDIVDAPVEMTIHGFVRADIAFEIARTIEKIMLKYGKATKEKITRE